MTLFCGKMRNIMHQCLINKKKLYLLANCCDCRHSYNRSLNYRIRMSSTSLPEIIGRGLLSNPIGLSQAVGGGVLRAQLFLGAILCWKFKKAPGLLPLLRCITDGQASLLLGAEKETKQQHHSLMAAFSTCFWITAFKWSDDNAAHILATRPSLPGSDVMTGNNGLRQEPV